MITPKNSNAKSNFLELVEGDLDLATEKLAVKSWHRQAAFMVAHGLSQGEICDRLGKNETDLQALFNLQYFRRLIREEIGNCGKSIEDVMQGQAVDALLTILSLQSDLTAPHAVRLSAANSILDRAIGKPVQGYKQVRDTPRPADPLEEAERLKKELKALEDRSPNKNL